MEIITLYEAVKQMRRLTDEGRTFEFIHATYNRDSGTGSGQRLVRRAKLRPAARKDDVSNADFKIFYYDLDAQLPRVCWQMLLLYFNGCKVVLT